MIRAIGVLAIVIALLVGVMYFAGWIDFQKQPGAATIEVQTGEMEKSARDAVNKGEKFIDDNIKSKPDERISP